MLKLEIVKINLINGDARMPNSNKRPDCTIPAPVRRKAQGIATIKHATSVILDIFNR